jgi:XTP/dITP diphosphohydrolase
MNSRLVIASSNPGKLREFRDALSSLDMELLSAADAGVTRFPAETAAGYEQNALMKAAFVAMQTGLPSLADDSGIEVDALDGLPGVNSARFGGDISDGERIALLLDRMRDVADGERGAQFVVRLVLATPSGHVQVFSGEVRGEILHGPRGRDCFGYSPVFFSTELGKTFGEATLEEKWQVSHRGRAIRSFLAWARTQEGREILRLQESSAT